MKLGFIGTGAITFAIVTGLRSTSSGPASILLSPRNGEVAADLASRCRHRAYVPETSATRFNRIARYGMNRVVL